MKAPGRDSASQTSMDHGSERLQRKNRKDLARTGECARRAREVQRQQGMHPSWAKKEIRASHIHGWDLIRRCLTKKEEIGGRGGGGGCHGVK